mgnify:CR=1 FL=1
MIIVELKKPQVMLDNPGRLLWSMPNTELEVHGESPYRDLVDKYSFGRVSGELFARLKALDAFECNATIAIKMPSTYFSIEPPYKGGFFLEKTLIHVI